jgi:hypothetical protein
MDTQKLLPLLEREFDVKETLKVLKFNLIEFWS